MAEHIEDHDRGLAHDLITMRSIADRRKALRLFAGASSAAFVVGCGGASSSSTTSGSGTVVTPAPTPTPTPTPTTSTAACIVDPSETAGPYPADGTNTSSGSTSNALTATGIVRSDIRSSFLSSTNTAEGVLVEITLTVVDVNSDCGALEGYAVYLWHCDAAGNYSLYSAPAESYLRGVQVTDANGQVTFTTIFPGCYSGRWPHMHFEVFSSLSAATSGRYAVLTSQLAMPSDVCSTVYSNASGYSASISNFSRISISSDNVFGDNSSAQIAQQTPDVSGSTSAGYTASAIIGIAR
ncbi:MAG: intradiol ring-cleavage dioxygenase [Sphingomonas sp.]|nr:intradiol ring-cleavage dioxygenase [Sphingomonas sp.]